MHLTIVITIDPVKGLSFLRVLVHSLNLQTSRNYDVVFYNQTKLDSESILRELKTQPRFPYRFRHIDSGQFLSKYPIWNLYGLMQSVVDSDDVGDYVLALHMEEFLDADYVEQFLDVLEKQKFDILMGNLTRTKLIGNDITAILQTESAEAFVDCLEKLGATDECHWSFDHSPVLLRKSPRFVLSNARQWYYFRFRKHFVETSDGYTALPEYMCEDVFAMSTRFARRYNWFLRGSNLYFEDVHICEQPGVCELARELKLLTQFPVYFNRRRIYHLPHERFYFQLEDEAFTKLMLEHVTDDPGLQALQQAISMYREGELDFKRALVYTRRNNILTGTQNLNYRFHMRSLERSNDQVN